MDAGSAMVGKGRGERKEAGQGGRCAGRPEHGGALARLPPMLTYCLHGEDGQRRLSCWHADYLNNINY